MTLRFKAAAAAILATLSAGCDLASRPAGPFGTATHDQFARVATSGSFGANPAPTGSVSVPAPVEVPPGFPLPPQPELHVLDLSGDQPVAGTLFGTGNLPIESGFVYFTDSQERFFATKAGNGSATLVAAVADTNGKFNSTSVFPKGAPVLVNALLGRNRRLVGLALAGTPTSVSPGTTYAVEFVRDQVAFRNESLESFLATEAGRNALLSQGSRIDSLISSGVLPNSDFWNDGLFALGNGSRLAVEYIRHAFAKDPQTANAWANLFSPRVLPFTVFAGNVESNTPVQVEMPATSAGLVAPSSVAQGSRGDDAVYVADQDRLLVIKNGLIKPLTGLAENQSQVDATPLERLRLDRLLTVHSDGAGNLGLSFAGSKDDGHDIGFICLKSGQYYGRAMTEGTFYRLGSRDGGDGYVDGPLEKARFRDPWGITFDDRGNIFVADRRNNRIRRIDRDSGVVTTVLGDGWPYIDAVQQATGSLPRPVLRGDQVNPPSAVPLRISADGRLGDQALAGNGSGLQASFNRPQELAWRKIADLQELYIYDVLNNVIRKAECPYGGSFRNATVTTIAGKTKEFTHDSGYKITIGWPGPATEGPGSDVTFDLARYNPDDPVFNQLILGGMAIDAELGRLFIKDTNNLSLRMLDLNSGQVLDLVRNNSSNFEGDSRRVRLFPLMSGLTVLRDHGVLWTDTDSGLVRRLHLEFGL